MLNCNFPDRSEQMRNFKDPVRALSACLPRAFFKKNHLYLACTEHVLIILITRILIGR